jgi:hypothetical protein
VVLKLVRPWLRTTTVLFSPRAVSKYTSIVAQKLLARLPAKYSAEPFFDIVDTASTTVRQVPFQEAPTDLLSMLHVVPLLFCHRFVQKARNLSSGQQPTL